MQSRARGSLLLSSLLCAVAALALPMLLYRRNWAALAILQACLFPIVSNGYTLLPLLAAYVDIKRRWLAWWVVGMSWVMLALQGSAPEPVIMGLCFFLPLAAVNLLERRRTLHPQSSQAAEGQLL